MKRTLVVALLFGVLASCALTPDIYDGESAPRSARIVPLKSDRPLVALALGSGGARGFAHVGVIKVLEEAGIKPDLVVGASSGAIVAALYAGGYDARSLERIAIDVEEGALVDFTLFGNGWVRGEALQEFVNRAVGERPIEKLARPFAVVATRARDGVMTIFNRGDTGVAVRASASVPNLFIPPVIHGEEYLDGGLTSPVPVEVARAMGADIVIAVDVSWFAYNRMNGTAVARTESSRGRTRYERLEKELADADIVITPRTVRTRMLDFDQKLQNIAAGEEAARDALPQIRESIATVAAKKRPLARAHAPAAAVVD